MSSSDTPSSDPISPHRFIKTLASFEVGGVEEVWVAVRSPPKGFRSYWIPEAVSAQSNALAGRARASDIASIVERIVLLVLIVGA